MDRTCNACGAFDIDDSHGCAGKPAQPQPRRKRSEHDPMIKVAKILSKTKLVNTCMEWQGAYFKKYDSRRKYWQYPEINFEGKRWRGNRLIWTLMRGPIPRGLYVLHRCNNPRCIYIGHLYLGTDRDNVLDARNAGTHNSSKGRKNGTFKGS